jgi:hypothetical protein
MLLSEVLPPCSETKSARSKMRSGQKQVTRNAVSGLYRNTHRYVPEGSKTLTYPCNRPWRSIELWDVEAPTLSRKSAHRWRWYFQPYASAALYPQEDFWYSFRLEAGRIRLIEESNNLIGNRTHDLPACIIVHQQTMLPRAPLAQEDRIVAH